MGERSDKSSSVPSRLLAPSSAAQQNPSRRAHGAAAQGVPLIEQSGVYALADLHGQTMLNNAVLGLGKPANLNLAGGTGALVANMSS